jgi:hypothetical protein
MFRQISLFCVAQNKVRKYLPALVSGLHRNRLLHGENVKTNSADRLPAFLTCFHCMPVNVYCGMQGPRNYVPWNRGRIQRKTWCMGPYAGAYYNLTLCPLQSRLQHIYHGQPYARVDFIPRSGTLDLASKFQNSYQLLCTSLEAGSTYVNDGCHVRYLQYSLGHFASSTIELLIIFEGKFL